MLPNDTDLTVFREKGVQGYNFAFIDSHYNTIPHKMTLHILLKNTLAPRKLSNAFYPLFSTLI
jgi:hypothetical protein